MGRPYENSVSIRLTGHQREIIIDGLTHCKETDEIELEPEYVETLDKVVLKFKTLQAKRKKYEEDRKVSS